MRIGSDDQRRRQLGEAVRDVEGPKSGRLTADDVKTLRDAGLDELADIAERYYYGKGGRSQ